jgi:sulfate adenylyltransferase subunit 2
MKKILSHLDWLESEAIHIMREVAGQCSNPVLLFSGGKDSLCLLRVAEKAFRPGRFPFPMMHIDTGHNYPVASLEDSMKKGSIVLKSNDEPRNKYQSITLLEAIEEHGFDCCIGGARRDEEKARAKERIMSFRDEFGQWDPKNQRPELWDLYNAKVHKGENIRAFPISNWTEMDVWQYIEREKLELPNIYFAHQREIVRRDNSIVPITNVTPVKENEVVENIMVRFRTVGDITCTAPVESDADTVEKIILETASTSISERGATRLDDQVSEASMEQRKKEGYF